uniref:Uncharacterized protein n=1 Tax=Anguilla anguilla TaxID=7936 RepID=A0A0E9Y2I4_ANGAN
MGLKSGLCAGQSSSYFFIVHIISFTLCQS